MSIVSLQPQQRDQYVNCLFITSAAKLKGRRRGRRGERGEEGGRGEKEWGKGEGKKCGEGEGKECGRGGEGVWEWEGKECGKGEGKECGEGEGKECGRGREGGLYAGTSVFMFPRVRDLPMTIVYLFSSAQPSATEPVDP